MHESSLFSVPLFSVDVNNWEKKKKIILDRSKDLKEYGSIKTNYTENYGDLIGVQSLFKEEIGEVSQRLENDLGVKSSWVEKAKKGMYHPIHNHGQVGLSAICYVEFDNEVHEPVVFCSPFNHMYSGSMILSESDSMSEGVILMFPSFIQHYTNPNKSDKVRTALSFNLEFS